MANLPLAFAEVIGAAVLIDAGIKGANIGDVVRGVAKTNPVSGLNSSGGGGGSTVGGGLSSTGAAAGGGINPFSQAHGVSIGRADMGVDATMAPGSPIVAPWDSTLTAILPNWYAGQPLLMFRATNGALWYIAEQITPVTTKIGATFKAGQPVGHFASSGTGVEFGPGGSPSGQTLAQKLGNGTSQARNAVLSFLSGLGIKPSSTSNAGAP